jgi:hypothetical protein
MIDAAAFFPVSFLNETFWYPGNLTRIRNMPKSRDYVFVLWGDKFEEATATIFVTELRKAGLRVKVVGLTAQRTSGVHGLALVPDLTLDQALPLAAEAICLIIPYTSRGIKRLKNDPRLRKFFSRARTNRAKIVIGQLNGIDIAEVGLFPSTNNLLIYPDSEGLVGFARELAGMLSSAI